MQHHPLKRPSAGWVGQPAGYRRTADRAADSLNMCVCRPSGLPPSIQIAAVMLVKSLLRLDTDVQDLLTD